MAAAGRIQEFISAVNAGKSNDDVDNLLVSLKVSSSRREVFGHAFSLQCCLHVCC